MAAQQFRAGEEGSGDGPGNMSSPSMYIDTKPSIPLTCDYTIGGVKVQFPCRAYSSQVAMMGKVISGLQRAQNSLIESPTGSGKTLALLCSTIAWQRAEADKLMKLAIAEHHEKLKARNERELRMLERRREREEKKRHQAAMEATKSIRKRLAEPKASPSTKKTGGGSGANAPLIEISDDDDDFVSVPSPSTGNQKKEIKSEVIVIDEAPTSHNDFSTGGIKITEYSGETNVKRHFNEDEEPMQYEEEGYIHGEDGPLGVPRIKVPKIYFGTRTHKQIEQVVRELKKTAYSDVRMTILSSREHTCLQKKPRHISSKTELCRELLEQAEKKTGPGCMYYRNVRSMGHHTNLKNSGLPTPWDLEDIIRVGKRIRCCPYFTARELMMSSEIILCPYNYLVSPMIRKSMDIALRGEVVILDEAHNIEDAAREAASMSLNLDAVREAMDDCEKTGKKSHLPECYAAFAQFLSILGTWMDKAKDSINDYKDYNQAAQVWNGTQLSAILSNLGIGEERFPELKTHLESMVAAASNASDAAEEWVDSEETDHKDRSMTGATRAT